MGEHQTGVALCATLLLALSCSAQEAQQADPFQAQMKLCEAVTLLLDEQDSVRQIRLNRPCTDALFASGDMGGAEFAQAFINAYNIP